MTGFITPTLWTKPQYMNMNMNMSPSVTSGSDSVHLKVFVLRASAFSFFADLLYLTLFLRVRAKQVLCGLWEKYKYERPAARR